MESQRIPVIHLQVVRDKTIEYGQNNLSSPEKAAQWVKDILGERDREYLVVCALDNRMKPTSVEIVGIGNCNSCIFSIPEIFKMALLSNSSAIFLFHNHTSGEVEPSLEDELCTDKVRKAGELLGVEVKDHIIIGNDGRFFSFSEHNWKREK